MSAVNHHASEEGHCRYQRRWKGLWAAAGLTAALFPVSFVAVTFGRFALSRHDAGGRGLVPACTEDTVTCSEPNIILPVLVVAYLGALAAGAAQLGVRLGRMSRGWYWVLFALSVGISIGGSWLALHAYMAAV